MQVCAANGLSAARLLHRDNTTKYSLLLGDTESLSGTASGLGALSANLDAEVVTETSVLAGLLHALEILTETGVDDVGNELGVGTITDATLSVEEPLGDSVLCTRGVSKRD